MSKYDLAGTHVLNKFVWKRLQDEFGMTTSDYKNLVPIIPGQQLPILNDLPSDRPFIVYTYVNSGYDTQFWASVEQVTYLIYGDIEGKLRSISNFLMDLLKRYDWSAEEINDFIYYSSELDSDDKKFDFKYTELVSGMSPEPSETEGGRKGTAVTVRLCYTHLSNNKGMRI